MEKKIGFFGGCFNPLTNAHLELIKKVIKEKKLDKVYFVPMGDLYSKKDLLPLEKRKSMLELVIDDKSKLDILDISNKDKKTYAIDTFEVIDKLFPDDQRFFIMGSDNYKKIHQWKSSNDLKKYQYIILDRENETTKDISSSMVREKVKHNEDVSKLIPEPIEKYIKQNNLYK